MMGPSSTDTHKYVVTDGSDLPQVIDRNAPEVAHESYPELIDSTPPEALPPPILNSKEVYQPPKERNVCGIRRRTFWIVLAVIILVVIAAAIGGGVGGSLASKKSDDASTTSDDDDASTNSTSPSNDDSASSTPAGTPLLANTKLASINYTDADGTENHHVYYQLRTKAIHKSAWNSSARLWETFEVTSDVANIKNNTPLAAGLYRHSATRRDYHVYYLDPSNAIRGLIASNEPYGPWAASSVSGRYTAGPASGLAAYGRACGDCMDVNVVVWQDVGAKLQVAVNTPWTQQQVPSSTPDAVNGTGLALGPVFTQDGAKYLSLYVNGEGSGNLTQLLWDGDGWSNSTLPTRLGSGAEVAAFAYGYNNTAEYSLQVVSSAEEGDGVQLTAWDADAETWGEGVDASSGTTGLQSVAAGSALAANQGGRVYGFVGNGSLGEWIWSQADGYTFNGWVNTTVV